MDIDDFYLLFLKLIDTELEKKVWEMWINMFPNMTKDNYISYEDMLKLVKKQEPKKETNVAYIDQVFF